jgi:hypothetical protein
MASKYNDVLTTIASIVTGVVSCPVKIRKLPVDQEVIDTTPLVCVVPDDRPEGVSTTTFEGQADIVYAIQVVGIALGGGNYDPTGNLPLAWRQAVRTKFQTGAAQALVPGWWLSEIQMGTPIDRGAISKLYDYTSMTVLAHVVEKST